MQLRRFSIALFLLLFAIADNGIAKDSKHGLAPQEIHDLRYGETLFNYYQQKYFSAITDLMVAQQREPISNQGDDPKLLLGGLYLAYGMQNQATGMFQKLLKNDNLPSTRDRIWYYIGKLQYKANHLQQSEQALLQIKNTLPPDREAERLQMLANIYIREKKYDKAIKVLRGFSGSSEWEAYAKFNLGVALVKSGKQQQGVDLLDDVGDLNPFKISHELNALRDKANLALGFAYLRGKQPDNAVTVFQRIRLKGPLSNKALLGLGWAYTAEKQYRKALNPWLALQHRVAMDTSVQESMIAIPYVMEKLGKKRLAMEYYDKAITAYTKEIKRIEEVMTAVQHGELLRAMTPANLNDETSLPLHTFGMPDSVSAPYLHDMMASNEFQESYSNLQNLMYLRYVLQHWEAQLPSYELILSERRKAYFERLPKIASDAKLKEISQMSTDRDKLAAQLKHIQQTNDGLALVNEDEADQLDTLNNVKKTLQLLSNSQDLADAKDKYQLMQGILYFRTQSQFIPRLWKAKQDLINLDKALARVKKTKRDLVRAANSAPRYFQGYGAKINQYRGRINSLLTQLDAAIRLQEVQIQNMAMQNLGQRRRQLQNYHVRARFGIARLYDSLVIEKDKDKKKNKDKKEEKDKTKEQQHEKK